MNSSKINDEVQKTMQSLDELKPADPGPYFYARMIARNEPSNQTLPLVWKMAIAMLVVVNLLTLILLPKQDTANTSTDPIGELSASYFGISNDGSELALFDQTDINQ